MILWTELKGSRTGCGLATRRPKPETRNPKPEARGPMTDDRWVALYFVGIQSYRWRVTRISFSASYYYGFFGYNRWGPRSSVR